jgi:hypothetical protein
MFIQWSGADQTVVVMPPDWAGAVAMPVTDGPTYLEAGVKGADILAF